MNGASIGGGERIDPQRLRDFATTVSGAGRCRMPQMPPLSPTAWSRPISGDTSRMGWMRLFWYARRIENGATRPDIRRASTNPVTGAGAPFPRSTAVTASAR